MAILRSLAKGDSRMLGRYIVWIDACSPDAFSERRGEVMIPGRRDNACHRYDEGHVLLATNHNDATGEGGYRDTFIFGVCALMFFAHRTRAEFYDFVSLNFISHTAHRRRVLLILLFFTNNLLIRNNTNV